MSSHDHDMPKACHRALLDAAKLLLLDNLDQSMRSARRLYDCDSIGCSHRRPCQVHVVRLLTGLNMAEMLSHIHRVRAI